MTEVDNADRPEVAWTAIEQNARVFSSDGHAVGKVTRVVGDANADIFTGLALSVDPLGPERFVAAERVRGIWPDRIEINLTVEEIRALGEYKDPTAGRWVPTSGLLRRLLGR